jgi:hypothetical protein
LPVGMLWLVTDMDWITFKTARNEPTVLQWAGV